MKLIAWLITLVVSINSFAGQENLDKKIWAHQAILASYQVHYNTYLADQKAIAKYFTLDAWKKYLQVLNKINYQQYLEKNNFRVDAVALKPIALSDLGQGHWQASMPVLVEYKNPQYSQLQTIQVTLQFKPAPSGQGVAGYQIVSYAAKSIDKPCKCMTEKGEANLSVEQSQ